MDWNPSLRRRSRLSAGGPSPGIPNGSYGGSGGRRWKETFGLALGRGQEPTAVNIFGICNSPGNQGFGGIRERDPLGASPFGLDPSHPRFCRQSPRVAGVKPALPALPPGVPWRRRCSQQWSGDPPQGPESRSLEFGGLRTRRTSREDPHSRRAKPGAEPTKQESPTCRFTDGISARAGSSPGRRRGRGPPRA